MLAALGSAQRAKAQTTTSSDTPYAALNKLGLTTLLQAVEAADLTAALNIPDTQWTIFAPTNQAFDAALKALGFPLQTLLNDTAELTRVLMSHIVPDVAVSSTSLTVGQLLPTASGDNITVVAVCPKAMIQGVSNKAVVQTPDVEAGKSIIHVIDVVLLPQALPEAPPPGPWSAEVIAAEGAGSDLDSSSPTPEMLTGSAPARTSAAATTGPAAVLAWAVVGAAVLLQTL